MLKTQTKNWLKHKFNVVTDTSVKQDTEHDEVHYARVGMLIVAVGFGGFMLWAGLAPLDKGVPAQGVVITDGHRQNIQAVQGGIVKEILVKDGDQVVAGQVLARMNATQQSAQNTALRESIASKQRQLALIKEQLAGYRELAKDGYMSRNKLIDAERSYSQVSSALAEEQAKLPVSDFDLANAELKAPVTGTVANLEIHTPGAVIQAGTKVMEVVPKNMPLIVEAHLPTNMIDKVHKGLPVEVTFPAFNQQTTPKIPATISMVAANTTQDPKNGTSYYKIQVQVTPEGKKLLADNQVRPGMPTEVFVVTGERTLLSYLFKPVSDRARSALREE
jgi:membrane fusion protein, protease secretion system